MLQGFHGVFAVDLPKVSAGFSLREKVGEALVVRPDATEPVTIDPIVTGFVDTGGYICHHYNLKKVLPLIGITRAYFIP